MEEATVKTTLEKTNTDLEKTNTDLKTENSNLEIKNKYIKKEIEEIGETKEIKNKQTKAESNLNAARTNISNASDKINNVKKKTQDMDVKSEEQAKEIIKLQEEINKLQAKIKQDQESIKNEQTEIKNLQDEFKRRVSNTEERSTIVTIFGIASGVALVFYGVLDGLSITMSTVEDYKNSFIVGDTLMTWKACIGLVANGAGFMAALWSTQRKDSVFDFWDDALNGLQIIPNLLDIVTVNLVAKEIGRAERHSAYNIPLIPRGEPPQANNSLAHKMSETSSANALKKINLIGCGVGSISIVLAIISYCNDKENKTPGLRAVQYILIGATPFLSLIATKIKDPKEVVYLAEFDAFGFGVAGVIQALRSCQ
jgi:cell division protein FtsB